PLRAAPDRPAPDLRRPAGAARRSARAAPRRDLGRDRQVTVAGARSAWRWIGGRGAATRAPARWAARWPPAGAARRAWGGPLRGRRLESPLGRERRSGRQTRCRVA